ncbi:rRNA maturation RNase YbeY [Sphaerobacter thermophilus]|uniref:rRNA maturation RNase YbeY n=1 Tax=Sphaerobacter thermophilus TaxID=2057 RepID=UPI00396D5AFB
MPEHGGLSVELTISPGAPPLDQGRLRALLAFAARHEGLSGTVGVWICTDAEIADLHLRFMNIPDPTDVLTFPADITDTDGPYLGDIAVSFDTAADQAADAGHSPQREIAYLALHGLLHLAGYDDLTPDERDAMLRRQDELIAAFEREEPGEWG